MRVYPLPSVSLLGSSDGRVLIRSGGKDSVRAPRSKITKVGISDTAVERMMLTINRMFISDTVLR